MKLNITQFGVALLFNIINLILIHLGQDAILTTDNKLWTSSALACSKFNREVGQLIYCCC